MEPDTSPATVAIFTAVGFEDIYEAWPMRVAIDGELSPASMRYRSREYLTVQAPPGRRVVEVWIEPWPLRRRWGRARTTVTLRPGGQLDLCYVPGTIFRRGALPMRTERPRHSSSVVAKVFTVTLLVLLIGQLLVSCIR